MKRSSGAVFTPATPLANRLSTDHNGTDEYAYKQTPTFTAITTGAVMMRMKLNAILGSDGSRAALSAGSENAANNTQWNLGYRRRDATFSGVTRLGITTRATNAGTVNGVMGSTNLAASTWYSVLYQSSGTVHSIYLNNVAETLTAWVGTNQGDWIGDLTTSGVKRLAMGALFVSNAASSYFDGLIDEVLVVNRVLTTAERLEWYNGGKPKDWWEYSFAADIQAAWHMGEGDDDAGIYDAVSTNDLTLVNITAAGDYVADVP